MKKAIAIVLSLVLALSVSVVAFAGDIYTCPTCGKKYETIGEYNHCIATHATGEKEEETGEEELYKCPTCGKQYDNIYDYDACIESHKSEFGYFWSTYIQKTIPELADSMISLFQGFGFTDIVKSIIDRAVSAFEALLQIDVSGSVAE